MCSGSFANRDVHDSLRKISAMVCPECMKTKEKIPEVTRDSQGEPVGIVKVVCYSV